jgi:polyferredoxin
MAATVERQQAYAARQSQSGTGVDLLRLPLVGPLLRWRGMRALLQVPLFLLSAVLVLHGLYGPELAPKNLATVLTWVHYRALLVLVLLVAGNFFCLACPFLVPRNLARRLFRPRWQWPRLLRNKWLTIALFVLILFAYELFGVWGSPAWTAGLIIAYFAAALVVDALFRHGSFCKWVCPIGQFNFVSSMMSPLEVQVRDPDICAGCASQDCIRGTPALTSSSAPNGGRRPLTMVSQRGCELALFQPLKVGNLDCTFCLDCVHACPHDNVGLVSRLPGAELWANTPRSGVGQVHQRKDLAALVLVFTFGALLNVFGMVSPVYQVQAWLSRVLGTTARAPILAILFMAGLVVEPAVLLGLAAWATRRLTGTRQGLLIVATRYAFTLVPLGFAIWLAHYAFHFFTGVLTVIPVFQNALAELVGPILGQPNWTLAGLRAGPVHLLEMGFLGLGLIGSWIVALRLARQENARAPWRAYVPWVILHTILWAAAVWLLAQPMEMRGTFLGG